MAVWEEIEYRVPLSGPRRHVWANELLPNAHELPQFATIRGRIRKWPDGSVDVIADGWRPMVTFEGHRQIDDIMRRFDEKRPLPFDARCVMAAHLHWRRFVG